ncbi:MAG: hypothetical protein ACLR5M_09410 [Bifidobacterium longum]
MPGDIRKLRSHNADKKCLRQSAWHLGHFDGQSGRIRSHQGRIFPFDGSRQGDQQGKTGQLVQTGIAGPDNTGVIRATTAWQTLPNHHSRSLNVHAILCSPRAALISNGSITTMTFEFAGDDDVWVFIDDVLVGDIGGIHNRASLSINFHTGDIKLQRRVTTRHAEEQARQEAGKAGDTSWEGNTFADDTNHTLKFFYLERGATDSNMELKFNLVTVPESDIIKFDQDGKFVQSAEFALYKTDENFTDTTNDKNALLGSGTTDEAGHLTLTNDDDNGVNQLRSDPLQQESR